jgi:hypothetical protein
MTLQVPSVSQKPDAWRSALTASGDQFLDLSPQQDGDGDADIETRLSWDTRPLDFELDFDFSVMGAMDEQLASFPLQAFVDLCWQSTVDEDEDDCLSVVFTEPILHSDRLVSCFSSDEETPEAEEDEDDTSTLEGSPVASLPGLPDAEKDVEFFVRDHDNRLTWVSVIVLLRCALSLIRLLSIPFISCTFPPDLGQSSPRKPLHHPLGSGRSNRISAPKRRIAQ